MTLPGFHIWEPKLHSIPTAYLRQNDCLIFSLYVNIKKPLKALVVPSIREELEERHLHLPKFHPPEKVTAYLTMVITNYSHQMKQHTQF